MKRERRDSLLFWVKKTIVRICSSTYIRIGTDNLVVSAYPRHRGAANLRLGVDSFALTYDVTAMTSFWSSPTSKLGCLHSFFFHSHHVESTFHKLNYLLNTYQTLKPSHHNHNGIPRPHLRLPPYHLLLLPHHTPRSFHNTAHGNQGGWQPHT